MVAPTPESPVDGVGGHADIQLKNDADRTSKLHLRRFALAGMCWLAFAVLALLVTVSPFIAPEESLDRAIQSITFGPLAIPFPFFEWVGGPGATYMTLAAAIVVLLFNRRAWLFAFMTTIGGLWYWILTGIIHRPRPTIDPLIRISEYHSGHTSFPSGHVIFITLSLGLVMLCLGVRYLPPFGRWLGWTIVGAIVLLAAASRIYLGAHWPLDVVASMLVATGWLTLVASIRAISDPALKGRST